MPVTESLASPGRLVLELECVERRDIPELVRRVSEFARFVPSSGRVSVFVIAIADVEISGPLHEVSLLQQQQLNLLLDFEAHFKSVTRLIEHMSFSRTAFYNWKSGRPMKPSSVDRLIESAPTPELRTKALGFKEALA